MTCNGKEHPLDADLLLRARQVLRDLEPQAELHLELPPGPRSQLRYTARMEAGTVAFADTSRGNPKPLPRARALHEGRHRGRLRAELTGWRRGSARRGRGCWGGSSRRSRGGATPERVRALVEEDPSAPRATGRALRRADRALPPPGRGARGAARRRARARRARRRRDRAARRAARPRRGDQEALAARTPEGFTPLHLAAFFGGGAAVRLLLGAGMHADADQENPARVRPLHSAVAARDHDAARALLEAGADPELRPAGRLHAAARRRAPRRRRDGRAAAAPRRRPHARRRRRPRPGRDGRAAWSAPTPDRRRRPRLKWTLPFERARACARSTKSSRLTAARNRRATSFSRAVSERRSSRPCLASSPNSTVAAIS